MDPYTSVDAVQRDKQFVKMRDSTTDMHNNAESYTYVLSWLFLHTNRKLTEFV